MAGSASLVLRRIWNPDVRSFWICNFGDVSSISWERFIGILLRDFPDLVTNEHREPLLVWMLPSKSQVTMNNINKAGAVAETHYRRHVKFNPILGLPLRSNKYRHLLSSLHAESPFSVNEDHTIPSYETYPMCDLLLLRLCVLGLMESMQCLLVILSGVSVSLARSRNMTFLLVPRWEDRSAGDANANISVFNIL